MNIKDFDAVVKVWEFTDNGKYGVMNIQEAYKDETQSNGYRVDFQQKFTNVYKDAYEFMKEFMKSHNTPFFVKLHAGSLKNKYIPEKNATTYYLSVYSMEEATDEDFLPRANRGSGNYRAKNGGNNSTASAQGKAKKATTAPVNDDDEIDLPF